MIYLLTLQTNFILECSPVYSVCWYFLQDGEITEELFTFQEVVTQIERMEEEVCDEHKALCDVSISFDNRSVL